MKSYIYSANILIYYFCLNKIVIEYKNRYNKFAFSLFNSEL